MTSFINQALLEIGRSMPALILAKATLAVAVALAAVSLAHRSRASVRHAFLAASFGVLAILPIVSFFGPQMNIPVGPPPSPGASAAVEIKREIAPEFPLPPNPDPPAPQPVRISLTETLLTVWLAVAALFLLPVAIGLWQIRSLLRNAFPWPGGQALAGGRVKVLLHEDLRSPMICGVRRPAIILPPDARTWNEAAVTRAIVHELEHARRVDWLTQCLARAVCAAYWFHPLVWIAWRKLTLEAERSCDDAVLARSEATAYADQLVDLAQRLSTGASAPVLAMANRADLARRVNSVLDGRRRRGRAGKPALIAACCGATFFVLALSPLRMVAEPPVPPVPQAPQPPAPPALVAQAPAQSPRSAASPGPASQAKTPPRFTSTISLVIVNVTIRDSSNNAVEGLKPYDFAIAEDDRLQAISLFEEPRVIVPGDLMSYYILGYYTNNPSTDGKFRRIG